MENNELYHYGIMGMKWGIRRYQNKDGTLTPAGRKRLAKLDEERSKLTKNTQQKTKSKRTVTDLSDDELRTLVNRLNMESRYKELTKPAEKEKTFTDKFVSNLKDTAAKELSTLAVKKGMAYIEKTIFKSSSKS